MHIPDILAERVYIPLAALSLGAVGLASWRARREVEERPQLMPLSGAMAAFIFAAQAVNFPVLPGVSGHLLGGVLAGVLLGPYLATLAMTAVFTLQATLLGDGGVLALGANAFNMGLVATFLGYGIYRGLRAPLSAVLGAGPALAAAAFTASFAAVLLGAFAAYLEIAASDPRYAGTKFLGLMLGLHSVIGLFEGAITVGVLRHIARIRPDLVALDPAAPPAPGAPAPRAWPLVVQMLVAAALVAFVFSRFASELPDGLEAAGGRAVPGGPLGPEEAPP